MRGKIVQFEAKTIYDAGVEKGVNEARQKYKDANQKLKDANQKLNKKIEKIEKGHKDATQKLNKKIEKLEKRIDEHAQRMLQDNLPLSTIEKYTGLPMSRIQELASDMGLSTPIS